MDANSLEALAARGFSAVPGNRLGDLGLWCRDFGESSGDARYSSIAETLLAVSEWWSEHDERGGIPVRLRDELEGIIKERLPAILHLRAPSDAAPLARIFREEIQKRLTGPSEWISEGYMEDRG